MIFRRMRGTANAGHRQRLWPAFVMLTAVVVLPTAGVFWFMNLAMQNEQLAMRQRLTELYRSQLQITAEQIQTSWRNKFDLLANTVQRNSIPEAFALLVKAGHADSILIYQKGRLIYPNTVAFPRITAEPQTPLWLEARNLEYGKNDAKSAAAAYAQIARQSTGLQEGALALISQARCLNKAQNKPEAIEVLVHALGGARYRNVADAQGRSISLNALLFTLQLIKEPSQPSFQQTAALLVERLNDYRDPSISSSQRRFLIEQLQSLWPDCPQSPTFIAEELAAQFKRTDRDQIKSGRIQPTSLKNIWAYQTPEKSMIALLSQDRLMAFINSVLASQKTMSGIRLSAIPPGAADSAYWSESIGDAFPSWKLDLRLEGKDPFQSAAKQKIATYVWIGILMTASILMLSLLLAGYLRRQVRLTQLKNDLIATVTHELKTPLASMRLLVDTLRDGHYQDAHLVQEYLQMISKENARLSSLIEGFLTFSRMERNKATFEREVVKTDEIVHAALEAVGSRLQAPGCRMELDLAPELPPVIGDRDALITVFVNLLDNALKYTGENKEIRFCGFVADGNVCFEVQDNGVGFPRSAAKKIFDRFYQVDRTLSRRTGGCGLGLSIVQFIVAAHNGSVNAASQPGKGSTFTVQLPAVLSGEVNA
jgi:signal transduction histidine kinase